MSDVLSPEQLKTAAFVAPLPTICGHQIRPLSAGTLIILNDVGNSLIGGKVGKDVAYQVASFIYIHTAPFNEVCEAASDPVVFKSKVTAFADKVSIRNFTKAVAEITKLIKQSVSADAYEVKRDEDDPIPNA